MLQNWINANYLCNLNISQTSNHSICDRKKNMFNSTCKFVISFATFIKLQNFCKRHAIKTKQNKNFLCIRYRFKTKGLSVCQTVFDRIGTCSYYFIQQKMLLNDIAVNSHFWFIWTNVKCTSGLFWRIISEMLWNLFLAYKT